MLFRSFAVFALAAVACIQAAAEPARAREWFVREGAEGGDGSLAKPFSDPWQALEKCEAGDAIHVAGGKYFGKLNAGIWEIPFDGVQLIGGYDKEFKSRDPWTNRTELLWDAKSKNRFLAPRLKGNAAKNCVVDGLVLDMKDYDSWTDDAKTGRKDKANIGENAIDFSQAVTVRNCVILNPDGYAIKAPPGSTIENNLIFNSIVYAVSIYTNTGDFSKNVATVKDNTILYTWGFKEPGKGGYDGACVQINGPAVVTNNILAGSDSNSIYQVYKAEKISITKNVFFQNLFSNIKCYYEGKDILFDDKSMADMEELGYKACDGNEVLDPQLPLDPAWLDQYTKRTAYVPGKVTMDDMNKLRQLAGLPIIAKGGTPALGVAPVYDLDKAYALLEPKNPKCKAGARKLKLESLVKGVGGAAASTKTYAKADFMEWLSKPADFDGKSVELLVAMGGTANVNSAPASFKKETLNGFTIYDKDGSGKSSPAFVTKGTNAERVCQGGYMEYHGSGKPQTLYVVRGTAYASTGYPKQVFHIETIEKYDPSTAPAAARPKGRDWFIVMGAAGGNGSKEKPFKDPWQALEKCESGDSIHIAEGEYYGKLKIGMWKIDTTYISLIGGYDKEFKERNPWTHPTLLFCPPDYKGTMRGGYMIEGEGDHTGAVVDGIIFDKLTNNKYFENGDIDRDRSDAREHLWLFYPGVVIRNCVFLNGNGAALRVCNGATIENNIFINHNNRTINMSHGHTSAPSIIRNNTLMFAWEIKFGEGRGRGGSLIRFETDSRSIVDNNIFEFADNDAIVLSLNPAEIVFTNNVFSHNLYSHVSLTMQTPNLVVDGANFKQLADLGFKKAEGNVILPEGSGCPVDQKFFDAYLGRTAMVPGKVTMDEWNQFREMLGQPVIATGGKGPTGYMPVYPWKSAVNLIPKNPKCKAGARHIPLEVKFEGIERKEETFEYAESSWEAAKDRSKWDALDKKRVQLKVAVRPLDNQYQLDDIKKEEYTAFQVMSVDDSGGLPMRCYIKTGTKYERVVKNAKNFGNGKPEESYVIKGIARSPRQMVVEVIERAD
ncbi:MAG TPA: right-handed parallel beta-helix repeat-containing protein [Planctomycetota bacterium]|nr:right-handed parallel beta-helix repeat-containing protein [Planctomycetota bacterium]